MPAFSLTTPRLARLALAAAVTVAVALPAVGQQLPVAKAQLKDRDGNVVGNAMLTETPAGVLLNVRLAGLPPGPHAFHIHATGTCEPPFKSAGGHLSEPDTAHGYLSANGPHLGDMPNIHMPQNGELQLEIMTPVTNMDSQLFDADGAALVIHEGADDYRSQPAGAAGERIACGVIERQTQQAP